MVKKKISGQTLAIIILTALLIIAVTFGGVYAFYSARSNQVTGEIRMATLSIGFGWEAETGESICSAIVLSNGKQVVPGQELNNTPLVVTNESQASIYLIIVYEVNAEVKNNLGQTIRVVEDKKEDQLIDLGTSYINEREEIYYYNETSSWVDYVFTAEEGETEKVYRVLVSTKAWAANQNVTVVEKDSFKLSARMNNDYQGTTISLTFQAYAIGSHSFDSEFTEQTGISKKCQRIVEEIYKNYKVTGFLKIQESA